MIEAKQAKQVKTFDATGKENGYLIELAKSGNLTTGYLSATFPGCWKGYHLHRLRTAHYVCLQGKIKIITWSTDGRKEILLNSANPQQLYISTYVPTALFNDFEETAVLINIPSPSYDPELKYEQVEFTEEELKKIWEESKGMFLSRIVQEVGKKTKHP